MDKLVMACFNKDQEMKVLIQLFDKKIQTLHTMWQDKLETLQLFIFLLVVLWDFWKSFLAKFSCSVVLCFTILASGHVNLAMPQPSKLVCFKNNSQTVKFKVLQKSSKYRHCYWRDPPCIALFLTWTVYVRRSRSRCSQIILTAGARNHHMSVKVTLFLRGDVKLPGSLNT